MADDGSRSFRRDEYSRDGGPQRGAGDSDPLAELARLIGQSEGYGGAGRAPAQSYDETTPLPELDWAAGEQQYAQHDSGAGNGYAPPADQYRDERAPAPRYTPPAGFDEPQQTEYAGHDGYYDQTQPQSGPPSLPYISPLGAGEAHDADRSHGRLTPAYADEDAQDDYDDQVGSSSRRRGTIVALSILGVVVLGTAGAFGYHAMFGGSFIPSLPPIITPGNTPVKIVPKKDAQAAPGNQTTVAKGEQLVPHEETPVEVQPANPPPRVVTTIPVISNAPIAPVEGAVPSAGPPPGAAPALPAAPSGPAQAIAPPDQLSGSGPASGSKPVRTVIIKPQPLQADGSAPTGAASATRPANLHAPGTRPVPRTASAGGPLSIIPGQQDSAPQSRSAPRSRTAMAHSGGPMPLTGTAAPEAPAARAGGYAVQVSSQRSEAEAQAAFRSLQAKYPRELGSRHAEVRRADLGAKGVYYRALVGPFASGEEAASMCRSLKAAGGSCIVQRN
jgi:sporulation related protein